MASWWNGKLLKCKFDKIASRWSEKLQNWKVEKVSSWLNDVALLKALFESMINVKSDLISD